MLPAPLAAAALNLSPVELHLAGDAPVATLTITNSAAETVAMEVAVFEWRPDGAGEVRVPTNGVIVSPPIFRIAPNGQQILRIAERQRLPVSVERAYRVVLTQIPDPRLPGVQIALRFDVPLYVDPARGAGRLEWRLERRGDGVELVAANRGTAHVRLTGVERSVAGAKPITVDSGPRVVLAGGERRWAIDDPIALAGLRLAVRTKQGVEQLVVPPPAR